ncbi:MAG: ATP synthase A1 subunit C [Nanoarchaeota archaeon]|nr:ATP synthase A1 subunit C [Nanoarchaeota archaeon]
MTKLKLGFYPYTYTRVTVMRSLLVKREDYHKLLKMNLNEVIHFLQESVYKSEINKLAAKYSGVELLEMAIKKNLSASFNKLRKISIDELKPLIDIYSKRKDIQDLKTILRAKYTEANENEVRKLIYAAGTLSRGHFMELFRMNTMEEILRKNNIVPFDYLKEAYSRFEKENILIEIESALDRYYYEEVMNFTKSLPESGKMFREFLESEIEIKNIMMLLRLCRENMDSEEIKKHLIIIKHSAKNRLMRQLIRVNTIENITEMLDKTKYGQAIKAGIEKLKKEDTLIDIEIDLYNYLLKKSVLLLHQHPLSVDVILGYMFAKEVEIRNINLITKGKQLGLSEDFIEKQLVMV